MRSLFWKIFLWFWATVVLVGLAMVVTWSMQRDLVVNRWRASLAETIAPYAQAAAEAFDQHGLIGLNGYLQQLETESNIHAVLLDATGTNVSGRMAHAPKSMVEQAVRSGQTEFSVTDISAFAAQRATGPSGQTYVLVVRTPGIPYGYRLSRRTQALRWTLALVISGLICYLLTRYLTRPILQLSMAARELAAGDLSARAGPAMGRRRDEMGELVQDFNRMAERIEVLVNSQRQLISDISHELRSPLARLNVALGLARQRAGNAAVAPLDRIEREAERLNELIGRILALARMETATGPPERNAVDLPGLLSEVIADAEFEAQEHGCSVQLKEPEPMLCQSQSGAPPSQSDVERERRCCVMGSAELLRSAVENVIRNAVRYTTPGTPIEITLSADNHWAAICVRDHGPGVPEAELVNLFRPFYRVADARERQTGGTGLGLAIADRAVRLHGGSIRAENIREGNGLNIEIRLPVTVASESPAPMEV
jgi:two-component system sensor histidine kinase CpxA